MKRSGLECAAIAVLVTLSLSGVARAADTSLYEWWNYERDFYRAYDQSEKAQKFEATLLQIIEKSDEAGRKPPPGLLGEYGYVLYKRGETKSAIEYFQREASEWPESEALMKRIIERAQKGLGS
jgi:hypothetical protein